MKLVSAISFPRLRREEAAAANRLGCSRFGLLSEPRESPLSLFRAPDFPTLFRKSLSPVGLLLPAVIASLMVSRPALAASETWLVKEESTSGVTGSQGNWNVNSADGKLTGAAEMQTDNGASLTYKLEGEVAQGVYTVRMTERSDGKKGCVWSGHVPSGAGAQTHGLVGYVECENTKLIVRASIFKK